MGAPRGGLLLPTQLDFARKFVQGAFRPSDRRQPNSCIPIPAFGTVRGAIHFLGRPVRPEKVLGDTCWPLGLAAARGFTFSANRVAMDPGEPITGCRAPNSTFIASVAYSRDGCLLSGEAACLVMPDWYETFGSTIHRAFAKGKRPVWLSNSVRNADCGMGGAGLLFHPENPTRFLPISCPLISIAPALLRARGPLDNIREPVHGLIDYDVLMSFDTRALAAGQERPAEARQPTVGRSRRHCPCHAPASNRARRRLGQPGRCGTHETASLYRRFESLPRRLSGLRSGYVVTNLNPRVASSAA